MDKELLNIARNKLERHFGLTTDTLNIKDEWRSPGATFVTLTENGNLRGCIGSMEAVRPLIEDLESNAIAAALRDPRFPPLKKDELKSIKIEISLLSELKEVEFTTQEDILTFIKPFEMGLLLEFGLYRGTFLPQVWQYYPKPEEFFKHLKMKAGLDEDFFEQDMKLYYYEVEKCLE
ncbi:MAG: AmmeMemoRadiSam system protein A [Spirochaetaceae bacterium]